MTNGAKLTRVLLKLSGEVLSGGPTGTSIEPETVKAISEELAEVHASGCQIGIVIGGGNIFRGLKGSATGMDRTAADHMGMLATVVNGIALAGWAREGRGRHARDERARDQGRVRALYSAARRAPLGEGPGGDFRRRHRQSVLLDRHGCGASRDGDSR